MVEYWRAGPLFGVWGFGVGGVVFDLVAIVCHLPVGPGVPELAGCGVVRSTAIAQHQNCREVAAS